MAPEPVIHDIFEPKTATWQYVVADPSTNRAVIIDSVLDFDPVKNILSTETADALLALISDKQYVILKILETHVHADHITASQYLQTKLEKSQELRPEICIGKRVTQVQDRFGQRYGIPEAEYKDAFDKLLDDDETFSIGELEAKAVHLPGHTPDHLGYVIGGNIFCGDSLFNPDVGSARCDFPGGDASQLYNSAKKILSHPEDYKVWTGHDYPPGADGRAAPLAATTISEQRKTNKHLKDEVAEKEFIEWRVERDSGLAAPRLLHQSLQMNIRAGKIPDLSSSGDRFLHMPVTISWEQ